MTRKDYELIAKAIKETPTDATPLPEDMKGRIAMSLAWELAKDNLRFDSQRFLRACGVK